jgi:predicted RNA-binding Zn ribbon-like protein
VLDTAQTTRETVWSYESIDQQVVLVSTIAWGATGSGRKGKMRQIESEAEKHHLIAGVLCLDFANTLYGHGETPIHEYLTDYRDLVVWSRKAGILSDRDAAFLIKVSTRRPAETSAVFHRAIVFRETIYRFFRAIAHNEQPKSADLAALNAARSEALVRSHIDRTPAGFVVDWNNKTAQDRVLWPIALSVSELLTEMDLSRVRQCSGCDWLFLDTSRNHLRRWCSMSACGNRAKVRRFNERKRKSALRSH